MNKDIEILVDNDLVYTNNANVLYIIDTYMTPDDNLEWVYHLIDSKGDRLMTYYLGRGCSGFLYLQRIGKHNHSEIINGCSYFSMYKDLHGKYISIELSSIDEFQSLFKCS